MSTTLRAALAALALLGAGAGTAHAAESLNGYRVPATGPNLRALAGAGFDVTEGRDTKRGTVDVVATPTQIGALKVDARLVDRSATARTPRAAASPRGAADAATAGATDQPFAVWTKYDAVPGDDKEQYTEQYDRLVAEHPGLVAKRVTGTTYGGREIVALQVTKGATGADIPNRPAVLYNAMQHAREWLAGETCRRTLDYMVDNYGKTTSAGLQVTRLVDQNELWFVCVNNPDGYEYTFTQGHRLWRKNLRDNDGDGVITTKDGVDPNRNFSANWGRDDEGSSPDISDETFRGPSAASEPETKAMEALFAEIHPVFQKNDHTAAELLLYPQGFQQDTPTADNPIFTALAGDRFKPGIEGFLPELSAGLYITNGDFTDWAYSTQKTLSYTPEGTAPEGDVSPFVYPDSPQQINQEFRRHLPFVLDLAESAKDPTEPVSHLGNVPAKIEVSSFPVSYGDPQPVQATLQRKLGPAQLRFRINGGPALQVPTAEWNGGERYYKNDAVYYHRVRGVISGTKPGDRVEAWFTAGGVESGHFTYSSVAESDAPVLLLSDEDWSGKQPNTAPLGGPQYLDTYKALLDQAGVKYDVYDVSAGRQAPDPLGVLSHYSHVVWYSGDDYVTRAPDAPGGSGIDRLAVDTQNDVREFLNEGGKLFYTGENAGREFAEGYTYNPFQKEEGEYCDTSEACIATQDDFLQYWLGAGLYVGDGGADPDGAALPVQGFAAPFGQASSALDPASHTAALLLTSSLYDPAKYPQWAGSKKVMAFDRPGASPFSPYTGQWFEGAGATNASYKRLTHEADLTGKSGAAFSFRTSYDLEADYDYLFVEIHTKGQDDWTTLKADNDLNSQDVGQSCLTQGDGSAWQQLHPFLAHYQTITDAGASCDPTGTSGEWWAATGNSGGWKQWNLPIPAAYLGKDVEISITVATDPATLGLGVWVDDAALTTTPAGAPSFATSFEADAGGFTTPGPPAGTESEATGWARAQTAPFVEGAAVATEDTVYTGFGLEKLTDPAARASVLQSVFAQLGTPKKPVIAATPAVPVDNPAPPKPPVTGGSNSSAPKGLSRLAFTRASLASVLKLGLRVRLTCPAWCRATVQLRVDKATQRKLELKSVVLGTRSVRVSPTGTNLRVRLSSAAARRLRTLKRVKVSVVVTVPGVRGKAGRQTVSLTLKR